MRVSYRRIKIGLAVLGAATLVAACGTRESNSAIRADNVSGATKVISQQEASSSSPTAGAGSSVTTTTTGSGGSVGATSSGSTGSAANGSSAAGAPKTGSSVLGAAGSTSAGSVTAGPASGSVVNVGVLGTFSGAVGAYIDDITTGIQVWAKWTNAHGGLNGHPVNVIVADDGGSPANFNSLAEQLVTQDHVIAMAFTTLGFAPDGNNSYFDSQHILTFATEGGLNNSYTDPWIPTSEATGTAYAEAMMFGYADGMVPQHLTKIAVLTCTDFSLCTNDFTPTWTSSAMETATGLQVVYSAQASLTTPDFTNICIAAKNAGAQGILLGMDTASIERLAGDCAQQGYHPIMGVADLLAQPSLLTDPDTSGAIVATKTVPWIDTSVVGIQQLDQAFAQYDPGTPVDGTDANGWEAGEFLGAAAAKLPANPTAQDVLNGLNALNGTDLNGLTYPLSFTAGQPSPRKVCYGTVEVQSSKFVSGPGQPFTCSPFVPIS
jgi:branched-chain amino acid transport system substrate-binding protein